MFNGLAAAMAGCGGETACEIQHPEGSSSNGDLWLEGDRFISSQGFQ
jgi:hypothetical protein